MLLLETDLIFEFIEKFPQSKGALLRWIKIMENFSFGHFAELKGIFPRADLVGNKTIFDVGGNKVRMITEIIYKRQLVVIDHVLTHQEYDEGKWRD